MRGRPISNTSIHELFSQIVALQEAFGMGDKIYVASV